MIFSVICLLLNHRTVAFFLTSSRSFSELYQQRHLQVNCENGISETHQTEEHPSPVAKDFLLKRQIRVRPPLCDNSGMLPLLMYRGARPEAIVQTNVSVPVSMSLSSFLLPHEKEEGDSPCVKKLEKDLGVSLSKSSVTMLSQWNQLSIIDRQRLDQKIMAERRASQPLDPSQSLNLLYVDSDMCVAYKPSGILSVPGPRRNPSLLNLVHDLMAPSPQVKDGNEKVATESSTNASFLGQDQMVVHRLDMDTSGLIVYALNHIALSKLHEDFRSRNIKKTYEALLVGHVHVAEMEIDLDLERDPDNLPFMRIAQPKIGLSDKIQSGGQTSDGCTTSTLKSFAKKFTNQAPKPSKTFLTVLAWDYLETQTSSKNVSDRDQDINVPTTTGLPVTRVRLIPHTGRTHQLRVHCSAVGYPIVGDDIYGLGGRTSTSPPLDPVNGNDKSYSKDPSAPNRDITKYHEIHESLNIPLCLHAKQLCLFHPRTGAPLLLECEAPF